MICSGFNAFPEDSNSRQQQLSGSWDHDVSRISGDWTDHFGNPGAAPWGRRSQTSEAAYECKPLQTRKSNVGMKGHEHAEARELVH